MQIVRGRKASRLHDLLVIRGKAFAIVQQFEAPYNRKAKNSLENLCDWKLIHENRESFPSQTICIIRYMFCLLLYYNNKTVQYRLILWGLNFRGNPPMVIYCEALAISGSFL